MTPANAQPPAVILFDVLGTLVHDPFQDAATEVFSLTPEELRSGLDLETLLQWEQGEIDEPTCFERLFIDRRPVDGGALKAYLRRSYRWLPGVTELLDELRREGRAMHVLSDYSVWYQLIEAELGLSRFMPWTFVSCHTRICKPAVKAFLTPARALGVPVERCLLVDDKESNCAVARRLGLDTIRFVDAPALRRQLEERRLP